MTTDDKISDQKLQYNTNRVVAGEEILLFGQSRMIVQGNFTYSLLGKAFRNK